MPLYEFRCENCHYIFESIVTLYDPSPPCPLCGASTVKLISKPSIRFKGSGFYVNDYGKRRHG